MSSSYCIVNNVEAWTSFNLLSQLSVARNWRSFLNMSWLFQSFTQSGNCETGLKPIQTKMFFKNIQQSYDYYSVQCLHHFRYFLRYHSHYYTVQKLKFSIKDFFSKCDQMVTFTKEILNGKLQFLYSDYLLLLFQISILVFTGTLVLLFLI